MNRWRIPLLRKIQRAKGITLQEGADQLVSERTVEPSETPPEILDFTNRGERESVSAREAADALTQLREGRLKELRGFEQVAD